MFNSTWRNLEYFLVELERSIQDNGKGRHEVEEEQALDHNLGLADSQTESAARR